MSLSNHIKSAVQRTALGGVGALMVLVGLGFLSAAAYILLEAEYDSLTACTVLGGGYLGLGLISIAFARAKPAPPPQPEAAQSPLVPLATAFLEGLNEGLAVRKAQAKEDPLSKSYPA